MIRNFTDKEAKMVWGGTPSRRPAVDIESVARRKLRSPPANRLEVLQRNRKSQ